VKNYRIRGAGNLVRMLSQLNGDGFGDLSGRSRFRP